MTNLEANKDILLIKNTLCVNAHICRYGQTCYGKSCADCEFYGDSAEECVKAMLAEHKEPIKLKQWEKDLIYVLYKGYSETETKSFNDLWYLRNMKFKEHFKGITDTSMTLKEILENCEVIENE